MINFILIILCCFINYITITSYYIYFFRKDINLHILNDDYFVDDPLIIEQANLNTDNSSNNTLLE